MPSWLGFLSSETGGSIMQVARRSFLVNSAVNLTAVITGGSLVLVGKDQLKEKFDKQEPEAQKKSLVNQTTDFALGGGLGFVAKKALEKSLKLKHLNKELSSTISKLQKLENNDLPGIEKILKDLIEREGIRYESKSSDSVESISNLLNAVLIHVESQRPYLEELRILRMTFAQPFADKLEQGVNFNAATNETMIHVLRSDKLTEYLATVITNALNVSGAGERIGKNTVDSLTKEDLVSDDGVRAFKQTVTKVLGSDSSEEALKYAMSSEIVECDTAGRLMNSLLRKYKTGLQDNDPDMIALKNLFAGALKDEAVSEKLTRAVCSVVADPNLAKEFAKRLLRAFSEKA